MTATRSFARGAGLVTADRAEGTPHVMGTVEVVGTNGAVLVREPMVGDTGSFEGSSGTEMVVGNPLKLGVSTRAELAAMAARHTS